MKQIIFLSILVVVLLCPTTQIESLQANPDNFSWDNVDGMTYLSPVKNQNFPYACNSGWAFSTVAMLEARIKNLRKAATPDISLSTQVLLSCDTLDFGCLGVFFFAI